MAGSEKSDLRQMACDEPEAVWSVANKSDDEFREFLIGYLKEENPEWCSKAMLNDNSDSSQLDDSENEFGGIEWE